MILKRIIPIALIFILTVVGTIFMMDAPTVFGAKLGGKWKSNPTYHCDNIASAYKTASNKGINSWNSALKTIGVSLRYNYASVTSAKVSFNVKNYGSTGWNAQGQPGPSVSSGTYTYGTVRYNTKYMSNYSAGKKKAIATHELGHMLGLAHRTGKVLMNVNGSSKYYDEWSISSPTAADRTDLDAIY